METVAEKIKREEVEEDTQAKRKVLVVTGRRKTINSTGVVLATGGALPVVVKAPDKSPDAKRVCPLCKATNVMTRRDLDPTKKKDAVVHCKTCGYNRMGRPFVWSQRPPERNAPCPCGSGKKYKKCCQLNKETRSNYE